MARALRSRRAPTPRQQTPAPEVPVAVERESAPRERRIRLLGDTFGRSAEAHERRLLSAARPALPLLLWLGQLARPILRLPKIGWITADPVIARRILNDGVHTTLLEEGGVGHLWSQVLGDWVLELFDGAGHVELRTRTKGLFTEASSAALVERAWAGILGDARTRLEAGETVDIAELSRTLVGRMVIELLGMPHTDDAGCRAVFAIGEELAATALGSTADTLLSPAAIEHAQAIVARLTVGVPEGYRTATADTVLGRCREMGLTLQQTQGLATLLMVAGTETAASAMGRMAALLVDTGEQTRLIADRSLTEGAVREVLRVASPAPLIGRAIAVDHEVAGRQLRAGDRVMILTWTANNSAGRFRVDRPYSPHHRQLWFGAGRHLCLGAPLARAELGAMLELLLGDGREIEIVRRAYGRRVLIPAYSELLVRKRR